MKRRESPGRRSKHSEMKSVQFLSCIKVIDPATLWLCLHCRYFKRCVSLTGLLASCLGGWIPGNGLGCIRSPFLNTVQKLHSTFLLVWWSEAPNFSSAALWVDLKTQDPRVLFLSDFCQPDWRCCQMETHSASSWLTPGLTFKDEEGNSKVESKH